MDKNQQIFELISRRLDQQMESVDSFTTKAGLVLATVGVVFAGYTQMFSIVGWITECTEPLLIIEIITLFIAGFCAFTSLIYGGEKGRWHHDPDPKKLYENRENKNIEDDIAKSMVNAYEHNRDIYVTKYKWLQYARYALYLSALVFIIHLILFFNMSETDRKNQIESESPQSEPIVPSVDLTNEVQKGDEPKETKSN
ncbi:MAG: hypothetical protein K9M10_03540 [Candidatus Pacebacteria bacterium]|nr:hypothetical protein [Candidatus Paceibacterota bacterium]MCF7857524.1 hypothetical protein [Candidatus Paceibacterota bacterium]